MHRLHAITHREPVPNADLLARLLCYGVRLPSDLSSEYLGRHGIEQTFIQGAIFMVGGVRPINTIVWGPNATVGVPLVFRDGRLCIETPAGLIACSPLDQPHSIGDQFAGYGRIGDYLKFHNKNTVFASPVRECVFGAIGKPCQFCTFEMTKPKPLPPRVFTDMFLRVSEGKEGLSLAIGPGTPNLRDHGVRYIRSLMGELFHHWRGPISVELVPPHNVEDLKALIEDGVGSIIMSIEVWDDEARDRVCPGKSYVSKAHYVKAWHMVTDLLGLGKVSSVLLVGLERPSSTRQGIDFMVEHGIVPTLIPFRPYEDIPLSWYNVTDHKTYIEISRYNVAKLHRHQIGPKTQVGCTECGGCSLEIEALLQ